MDDKNQNGSDRGSISPHAISKIPKSYNDIGKNGNSSDKTANYENQNADSNFKPKTTDELSKERKNRKLELVAGAIGDMGSAFTNLFFTDKGAPSMINTTGKKKQPTLMERIYGRHKEEDKAYNSNLSAWEKEQEKKREEVERLAKENERENIHPDFKPLKSHWQDKEYIGQMFEDLLADISIRNKARDTSSSKLLDHLNYQTKNVPANVQSYIKQSILYDFLDGSLESLDEEFKEELDEEFINNFRNKWRENDSAWEKMK